MIRTFIAIPLPDNLKEMLGRTMSSLRKKNPGVRWVKPEGIHLTLKFLGDIAEDLVEDLSAELDNIARGYPALSLRFSGFGAFPNTRRPRVIWVGLAGDLPELAGLASQVDAMCSGFGIEREKRAFSAHITLGRLKVPSMVDLETDLIEEGFSATQVLLYRSELLPTGARHTILHRSSLGHKGGE